MNVKQNIFNLAFKLIILNTIINDVIQSSNISKLAPNSEC